ncbi:MAG: ORF6N domain-containing protein [Azonexus sp.]|nr:ORF6N domain-containing protein [Azonexus sp.]
MSELPVRVDVQQRILALRGERVMIDSDLAELYGVEVRVLNQAVKRNAERFPNDFSFVLSKEEKQEVITKCDHLGKLKFSPHLPRVFTEHGAIMAASVLNSPRAVEMSVFIVRAFVRLRQMLLEHKELAERLDELEARIARHDNTLSTLVSTIRQMATLSTNPSRQIGFVTDPQEKKP